MLERRRHDRSRAFQCGTLAHRGHRAPADCVVRNLSEGGALLLVAEARRAPSEVDLDLSRGGTWRPARVVWRTEAAMGVAFLPNMAPAPSRPSAEVVSLDAERRARPVRSAEDRLAERIAQVLRPRAEARPHWISASPRP